MMPMRQLKTTSLPKLLCTIFAMYLIGIADAKSETFRYQYIPLNQFIPPLAGYGFVGAAATGINDRRQVALTITYCKEPLSKNPLTCIPYVGLYRNGTIQLLQELSESGPVNNRGTVGGKIGFVTSALFNVGALSEEIVSKGTGSSVAAHYIR